MAKNFKNLTTTLIPDETLLRPGLHILFTGYLEDGAPCFIKVTEYDNTGFDYEVVEDEDSEEDGKEAVTDLEEEASKKKARRKRKRDAIRARALLLAVLPRLFVSTSASVLVPGLSTTMPRLSAPASAFVPMPRLSTALPELSAAVPGLFVTMHESSAAVPGSSTPASASALWLRSFALVLPLHLCFLGHPPCFFLHYLR